MDTVVSGIRPTGHLHLGNYFGALINFIKMQENNNCYFFIADYHSLTTHPTPENLHDNIKNVLAEFIGAGLDPEKSTIYLQSDLPETLELYLYLNMNAYLGELERVTSFKDKARKQPDNINAGLLTYPTLMAADILIHRALKVPVGKDQEQHLEMTRTFANRFNRLYNVDYFAEPTAFNFGDNLIKVPGLNGTGKMGKSEGEGNALFLIDSPEIIKKKIMRAVTDSGPLEPNQKKPEVIENIFSLMRLVSAQSTIDYFDNSYNNCSIKYGEMKKQLAEDMNIFVTPLREKINMILSDGDYLRKAVKIGREKAKESAGKTIEDIRKIIGFKQF